MSEQTLNMLKKLSPKKEHSLAFRCFIVSDDLPADGLTP